MNDTDGKTFSCFRALYDSVVAKDGSHAVSREVNILLISDHPIFVKDPSGSESSVLMG